MRLIQVAALCLLTATAQAQSLAVVAQSGHLAWSGVARAADGRIFTCFARSSGDPGPSLATLAPAGSVTAAYPGGAWNEWNAADHKADPQTQFVDVTAIRIAPDGALWVVDAGVPAFGKPVLEHAAKLVRFDLATNLPNRIIALGADIVKPKSLIGQIRFTGSYAYLTDAGVPGLIVVDLAAGTARRVLDGDPSTVAQRPVRVDGVIVKGADGKPLMLGASCLELSPDGKFLYYQPASGPMSRVPTTLLDDPKTSPQALGAAVEFWYDTPALGGSAMGADGTLYLDDVEHDSVLALSPDRALTTIVRDARLHWPDAPFLDGDILQVPVSQFDRMAGLHHGKPQIQFPLDLFGIRIALADAPRPSR